MNAQTGTNTPQAVTFIVAPPMNLATEVRQMNAKGAFDRLPEIARHEYTWYAPAHKRAALKYAEAQTLAAQMSLSTQVTLNAQQVIYWLITDLAAHTYALAHYRMGYNGEIACRQYPIVAGQTFRELVYSDQERRVEWVFDPIERFAKLIPGEALKAVKRLADEGIVPEAFWVADKIETTFPRPAALPAPSRSRSVDPILCAQFGTWLVGIAMWL